MSKIKGAEVRMILYTDIVEGEQACRDDLWAISTNELSKHRLSPVPTVLKLPVLSVNDLPAAEEETDEELESRLEYEKEQRRKRACCDALEGVSTDWIKKYAGGGLKNIVQENMELIRKEDELTEKLIAAEEENAALRIELAKVKP